MLSWLKNDLFFFGGFVLFVFVMVVFLAGYFSISY